MQELLRRPVEKRIDVTEVGGCSSVDAEVRKPLIKDGRYQIVVSAKLINK